MVYTTSMNHFEEPETLIAAPPTPAIEKIRDLRTFKTILDAHEQDPEQLKRILENPDILLDYLDTANRHHEERYGETYSAFREQLLRLADTLDTDGRKVGDGTSNTFHVFDPTAVSERVSPSVAGVIGERKLKRITLTGPKGEPYLGIPVNADQPDPVGAYRNGMAMLAFGYAAKGVFPQPYFFVEETGARDLRTGNLIVGLEHEVVGIRAYMEAIHGPSVADIVDRDGLHWKRRYSARREDDLQDFLQQNEEYIAWSVQEAVSKWPGLRSVDWGELHQTLVAKVRRMNGMEGGLKLFHFDLHFGNTMLAFDMTGQILDRRGIVLIDPDLSTLSADPSFGMKLRDYRYEKKSTDTRDEYFMPDRIPDKMTERKWGGPFPMDAMRHHAIVFQEIERHIRDITRADTVLQNRAA
ncbi:MAG: hypothetical protein WCL23_04060 [Candidatus Moraniibacteriota bacterium]